MTNAWRNRVLQAVDASTDAMIAMLADLVAIPSLTGTDAEHEAQAWFARRLQSIGLDVDHWQISLEDAYAAEDFPGIEAPRTEAWGLVGRAKGRGDGPSLMLNGHIDVVPEGRGWTVNPFSPAVRDGVLHGRGACDMKGGLVAAYWAASALLSCEVPLRGDLLVASAESEEDGGLGTFATLRRGWSADACVIPEPTGLDLVPAAAGALTFRLRIPGLATHASRRTEGVSAIEKLWPVWQALHALEQRRNAEVDPLASRWALAFPLSIGTVRSGVWASSVPDELVADGRFGVQLGEAVAEARAALEQAVGEACDADPWLREHPVEIEWWGGQFASGRTPESSDLPARMRRAHRLVGGPEPQSTWAAPYGSDLRLMTAFGVPTVHYGPGDAAKAHAPDESVPLSEVAITARALALLALDICGA